MAAVSFAALHACAASHDVGAASALIVAGGAAATVTAARLCEQLSTLQCAAEQRCCAGPGRSADACRAARTADCEQTAYLDAIATNGVTGFDAAAAERLFSALERKFQACDVDIASWSAGPGGLRSMFKGTVAAGQSCKPAQVLSAEKSALAAALLSCRDPATTACLPVSVLQDWTCAAKGAAGGSCVTDDNCQGDAHCNVPAQSLLGVCQERLDDGAACSAGSECRSFVCSDGVCVQPDQQSAYCPS